jgi:hypothetical protein
MLDRAACAALTVGEPQVSVPALCDLGRLLLEHGLRRRSTDDQDVMQMNGLSVPERNAVLLRLARLLMEAAGVEIEEGADDGR